MLQLKNLMDCEILQQVLAWYLQYPQVSILKK